MKLKSRFMTERTFWKSSKLALARVFKEPKVNLHPLGPCRMEGKAASTSGQESASQAPNYCLKGGEGPFQPELHRRHQWQPSIQSRELRCIRAGEMKESQASFHVHSLLITPISD